MIDATSTSLAGPTRARGHEERIALAFVLFSALLTGGCAGEPASPPRPTITTVDGVRIVDNAEPTWREGEAWTVSPEPFLTLGVDAGEPSEMFTYPQVVRLSDGRIVVGDRGSLELRYFAADGTHLFTRGGRGEGPGEFLYLGMLTVTASDEVVVFDDSRRFVHTVYDRDGNLVDTLALASPDGPYYFPQTIGGFDDGSLLVQAAPRMDLKKWIGVGEGEIGWYRVGLFHYNADGNPLELLADVGRWESTYSEGANVAFAATGHVAAHTAGFCYSDSRSFEIQCYEPEIRLVMRVRWEGEVAAVSEADRRRYIEQSMENVGNFADGERWMRQTAWATSVPVLNAMEVDGDGNIWAERHIGLLHSRPLNMSADHLFVPDASPWEVFSPNGTWLGRVDLIPGRTVAQIGNDWILMTGEDEAGVAHVWLHELIKP